MSLETKVFGLIFLGVFITAILYVLFGQITVRKLRKNPATKNALGLEFISGWDIINAAEALAMPRWFMKKLEKGPLSGMYGKSDLLRENTTKLDRCLAKLFYSSFALSGGSLLLFMLFDVFGFWE